MGARKNIYYRRARSQTRLFCRLLRAFAMDLTATEAARLTGVSVRSVNTLYLKLRRRIAAWCEESSLFAGEIVSDCRKATLVKAIRGRVNLESMIHSDGWRGYNELVDMRYRKHLRVDHEANVFTDRRPYINGIENFWSFAKRRLAKFNGLCRHTFYLHFKETEFRFNHRRANLYRVLLRNLRRLPP